MSNRDLASNITTVISLKYNYIFIIVIAIIGLIKLSVDSSDPIDNGPKIRKTVAHTMIMDKSGDGFELYFQNSHPLTDGRIEEMMNRPSMFLFKQNLYKMGAKTHNTLLRTDPYDIVDMVYKMGIPDSLQLHYVEGVGENKRQLYLQPNPNDTTAVTNPPSLPVGQGMVYLVESGISNYIHSISNPPYKKPEKKWYKYKHANFNCPILSSQDEQFTHISRAEINNRSAKR